MYRDWLIIINIIDWNWMIMIWLKKCIIIPVPHSMDSTETKTDRLSPKRCFCSLTHTHIILTITIITEHFEESSVCSVMFSICFSIFIFITQFSLKRFNERELTCYQSTCAEHCIYINYLQADQWQTDRLVLSDFTLSRLYENSSKQCGMIFY